MRLLGERRLNRGELGGEPYANRGYRGDGSGHKKPCDDGILDGLPPSLVPDEHPARSCQCFHVPSFSSAGDLPLMSERARVNRSFRYPHIDQNSTAIRVDSCAAGLAEVEFQGQL